MCAFPSFSFSDRRQQQARHLFSHASTLARPLNIFGEMPATRALPHPLPADIAVVEA